MEKKIILVTGASSGIGKVTALQLIKEGHIVYGCARRVDKMLDLVAAGGFSLAMDVTKETEVKSGIQKILDTHGKLDVLVNNAGYAVYGAVEDVSIEDAKNQFDVNLFGLARITQLVLPSMRAEKKGTIINIGSMGGQMYTPMGAWYHATKYALEGWSDCLRLELKPFGINVVLIEPGLIITEFGEVLNNDILKRSGTGAYANMAKAVYTATQESYGKGEGSPATLIAKVISKAVASQSPKTRYLLGKFAKPMVFIRKYLGTTIFDKIIMMQVNRMQ